MSIEGVEAGTALHVTDLQLPAGVEVELDPETVVVSVQEAAEEAEEDAEAVAESAAPAEGDAE